MQRDAAPIRRSHAEQQNQAVMFTQANTTTIAFSVALGSGGDPAWGAKKVGEKPSFSPRASGGVSFRYDRYFGLVPK